MKDKAIIQFDERRSITRTDFMKNMDEEIEHLYETGDVARATHLISSLDSLDNVAGHAKAKFLYGFHDWWQENKPDESFTDHIESFTSTRAVTVKRYVLVWRQIEQSVIPLAVAARPMRDLIPIAKCIAQGHEISKADWRKIELAANDGEIRDILRKIKGQEPRKSAKVIRLERDGTISLWVKDEKKFIGFLNVRDAETDKDISEVIEKIKSIGMVEE